MIVWLFVLLLLTLFFIRMMFLTFNFSVRLISVIDFILLGGLAVYYGHTNWFPYIANGNAVYFWDIVLLIIVLISYRTIIKIGSTKFPRLSLIFHYVMAWGGTALIYVLISAIALGHLPRLLNFEILNVVVNIILISLLAWVLYTMRLKVFHLKI